MILHCTPPYWHKIPNAALGYLKGFLKAHDVPVTNVYWNLILSKRISTFQKSMIDKKGAMESFPSEFIIFYVCKHLLGRNSHSSPTIGDQIFSSLYTEEEVAEVIHKIREDIDTYIAQLTHLNALSGFTMKMYQWLMGSYIINQLKDANPDGKVVIGGIYNEEQARTFLRIIPQVDYAVWGEGEYPLLQLARAVEEGTPLDAVPQLVYRHGKKCVATNAQIECPPLDEYPFADHTDYFTLMKKIDPFNKAMAIPIWGSRACVWNKCKFCALNEGYQYRTRSPENIVKEMEYQSKKHKIDEFYFTDSDIAGNKKRFMTLLTRLMQSIRERRKPYRIAAEISPLFIDSETAQYMNRAGFYKVQAGFEALSESLLKKMRKRQNVIHNIQAMKIASQNNINIINVNIIRGIPPETEEDVKETCTNLKFLRFFVNEYRFQPIRFFLLDRSPFYNEMSETEKENWKTNLHWEEIIPYNMIPEVDRFKFFNFYKNKFDHYHLWETFANLLRFYGEGEYSYTWVETSTGSFVEEKGRKPRIYELNQTETDILVFCDTIKSFSEIQKEFPLPEAEIRTILYKLKDFALLYVDTDNNCISILDAAQKSHQK